MKLSNLPFFVLLLLLRAVSNASSMVPEYDLHLKLFPEKNEMQVNGTVRFQLMKTDLYEIHVSLANQADHFLIDSFEPAALKGQVSLQKKTQDGRSTKWSIHSQRPLPVEEPLQLRFSYTIGGQTTPFFHIGSEISFASAWGTDWYPLIVTDDDDRSVGKLTISVPETNSVVADGERTSSTAEEQKGVFRFEYHEPTYWSFAAAKFTIVKRQGNIPVSAYLLKNRDGIQKYLERTEELLQTLEQEFGKYPFPTFALVEVPRKIANEASFNAGAVRSFIYVNSNAFDVPSDHYDALVEWYGHEFSHQWWPHQVALKTPPGLYMEEAVAEYGGLRAVEAIVGSDAAAEFRKTGYRPDPIYSALSYFKLVGTGKDHILSNLPAGLENRQLAYSKGFFVWDMLSREIGRPLFQKILREIGKQRQFHKITWSEFLAEIQTGSGKDLKWFYDQWFEKTGAPDWSLTWKQIGNELKGEISQSSPHYQLTVEVQIQYKNNHRCELRELKLNGERTQFVWKVDEPVQSIILDPNYLILHWTPEFHAIADLVAPKQN